MSTNQGSERWVSGSKEAREGLRWIVMLVGAVAAVLFGAGPILTAPSLSITQWQSWRIALALIGVGTSVYGVTRALRELLKAMIPAPLTLGTLSTEFKTQVSGNPSDFLPDGLSSVDDLIRRLSTLRAGAHHLRRDARVAGQDEAAALLAEAVTAQKSYNSFAVYRDRLLDRAEYLETANRIDKAFRELRLGAAIALVGGVAYLFALPVASNDSDFSEPAILLPVEGRAEFSSWQALGVISCLQGEGLPVLMDGVSEGETLRVRTLGIPTGCPTAELELPKGKFVVIRSETKDAHRLPTGGIPTSPSSGS